MNLLRGYPSLNQIRKGRQEELKKKTSGLTSALAGPSQFGMMGEVLSQDSIQERQAKVLSPVSGQYLSARGELDSEEARFNKDIKEAYQMLGDPTSLVNKTYDKLLKDEGIDIIVGTQNNPEATYRIPYSVWDDLWKGMHDPNDPRHEEWKNSPWKMGSYTDENGVEHMFIDPNGYGKELHEMFIKLPEEVKAGMLEGATSAIQEGKQKIGEAEFEGMQKLAKYNTEVKQAANDIGALYANTGVDLEQKLKNTEIDQGYQDRKKERANAFSIHGV